ncbi:MAG: GDP-mannose 4,6-dehydratase, partial [Steroidobacteraceae bacterium]
HCRGIDLILKKGRPGEVYNIGGGAESENLRLVQTLCAVADEAFGNERELASRFSGCPAARGGKSSSLIQFVKDRPGHDRRYAIDCGKIESELGYRAQVALASGLRGTFEWYVQNEWWWRAVMDGSYQRWIETHYQ